jgi:hypothetical protein
VQSEKKIIQPFFKIWLSPLNREKEIVRFVKGAWCALWAHKNNILTIYSQHLNTGNI